MNKRDVEDLRQDALLCAVMAVTFPWFVYFGERIKRLQRGLTEASIELEDIEEAAWRDELTGVYNRRAINVALDEAKQRADAISEPLALCVIDLDHFKRFNDSWGTSRAMTCCACSRMRCRAGCATSTCSAATGARSSSRFCGTRIFRAPSP